MQIGYLGPLEVRDGDRAIPVPGRRVRSVLTRLAMDVGRPVSTRALIEAVWVDDAPSDPTNALQSLVSRSRRMLGDPSLVEQVPGGYRLTVPPQDVDAVLFAALVAMGRGALQQHDPHDAVGVLEQALAMWRGEPLADADDADPDVTAARTRLGDLRLQAKADRIAAHLQLDRGGDVLGELDELVAANPLREDLVALQMTALVAQGRPAEALAGYAVLRSFLADTLGSDPSPELQAKHLEVLRLQEAGGGGRTNLRAAVTSFVGRDIDAHRVERLLDRQSRLVTVVGAGGSGKTRLATEVARAWVQRMPDGVWVAELAPVSDPDSIALAVLDGIGIRDVRILEQRGERPVREARERVLQVLQETECLVVLDNCEHVIEAAAALAADILGRCPQVKIIATSREPLGIDGESLYPLTPLELPALPALGGLAAAPEQALADVPAVRLLLDRARAAGAPIDLGPSTTPDVVEIVRRLDGLPLAIELAAARLRVLPLSEVASRLADRFRLLTGGKRTAVPRHRTLRAVVEWSWDLLDPLEREVAEHFSVFGSGATPSAVAHVCPSWHAVSAPVGATSGEDVPSEVEEVLHALVDKSILVTEQDATGSRFRMLETLREYGSERLVIDGTIDVARERHARYYASLVASADVGLRTRDQSHWVHVLDVERDNVLTGLAFLGDSGDADAAVSMTLNLSWFWMLRENGQDAARWLRFALAVPGAEATPQYPLARAMEAVGSVAIMGQGGGEVDRDSLLEVANRLEGMESYHQAVPLLHTILLFVLGEHARSLEIMQRNLASADPWIRAATRSVRVAFAENDGDLESMRQDIDAGLVEWEAIGDHWGLSSLLSARGQVRTLEGDLDGARADLEAALGHIRLLGGGLDDLMLNIRLADLRLRVGDVQAAQHVVDAIRSDRRYGDLGTPRALMGDLLAAGVAQARGDLAEQRRLYAKLVGSLAELGEPNDFEAHGSSVANAYLAQMDVAGGDEVQAHEHLRAAYRQGLVTQDLPIIATAGTASAALALFLGDAQTAAVRLGAAARLRGSPDWTSPTIARLAARLREALGEQFDACFATGQALDRQRAIDCLDPDAVPARRTTTAPG